VSEQAAEHVEDAPAHGASGAGLEAGHAGARRAPVPAGSARVATPARDPSDLLALQRKAGNAAVARWLARDRDEPARSPAGRRQLSRYEAGEHAQFGSDEKVMVNGVPISKGNIIAMGDFFRTPEDMNSAPPSVLRNLDEAITRDKGARLHQKGPDGKELTAPTDADLQKITLPLGEKNSYMELNKSNQTHFAPPAGGGGDGKDHKTEWEKLHRQALDQAHAAAPQQSVDPNAPPLAPAPSTSPPDAPPVSAPSKVTDQPPTPLPPVPRPKIAPQNAVVTNMFAAHFLTDAFAAGHLINKTEVMEQAKASWNKMDKQGWILKENKFTKEVSARVLENDKVKEKMANMEMLDVRAAAAGTIPGAGPFFPLYSEVTKEHLSELLYATSWLEPDTFFNIFARMVHDRLNKEGVEVTNGIDPPWKLSGDTTLNETSLQIGRKAVQASEDNLEEAASTPGDLPYDTMFKSAWKFVPHPTPDGLKFIDEVRTQLTNGEDADAITAAVDLSVAQIETAIDEMVKMGILRPKKGSASPSPANAAPGASPAPAAPAEH
jgi:hypothetical protein